MYAKLPSSVTNRFLAGSLVPLPRHLLIEITSQCNLKCRMCPKTHHAVNTEENQVMSWAVFERLLPLLPHIESLDLNGIWGEAFLHPELYLRMLAAIKAYDTDVYTMSNGVLLTDRLARKLVELDLNRLVVSVDAAKAETYALIRPPGRFDAILNGLRALSGWKQRLGWHHPRVELAFVGMRSNIEEFPDLVQLAATLGVDRVNLQAMGEYPGLEGESIATHEKQLGRRIFEQASRIGAHAGVEVRLLPADQFQQDRGPKNTMVHLRRHRKQCYDLWNRAVIAANGQVLPCCASPTSMGNMNESTFIDIWRGQRYNGLRRQFLSGSPPEMCRHCTGTAWVEDSRRQDLDFYLNGLLFPRARRMARRRLKKVPAARWVKRGWERLKIKSK